MASPTNSSELADPNMQIIGKRRRKKSMVWEHFTIVTVDAGCTKAHCMHCGNRFAYTSGSKLAGTSHLKRHIQLGICPALRNNLKSGQVSPCTPLPPFNGTQLVNVLPRKRHKITSRSTRISFYHDSCRHDIAKMIIMHDYPLDIVKHPPFLDCVQALHPQFPAVPVEAMERECVDLYLRKRNTLMNLIDSIPGRVNLSLELLSTDQSVAYALIKGQFIDEDWKLHRRILSAVLLPFPDSESALNHAVFSCITDWNLENRLLAVTLDQSFANKAVRENLRNLLSVKNPLILNGNFLMGSCFARVLCCLAQDALGSLRDIVKKVRDCVKYVVTLEACQARFNDLKLQLQVPSTKSLVLDDQTQWNSTYYMLVAACELKEVFPLLDFDPYNQVTLAMDEWKQVEILCRYLKHVLDAANILTTPTYPTANAFFHEAWNLQLELKQAAESEDEFVRNLTRSMHERFDKYWKDCFLAFSIAVVMDPRFKMKLVEFSYRRIYGEDADPWIKFVSDGVHELFLDYVVQALPLPDFLDNENGDSLKSGDEEETSRHCEILRTEAPQSELYFDGLGAFDLYISDNTSHENVNEELDRYLEETVLPRKQEFDVLGWWKENRISYPTLSKMASDILCIPFSTVSQDSVFDMTCKKMDRYQCSLRPSTVEALICAKDWLQYGFSDYSPDHLPLVSPKLIKKKNEF